MALPTAEQMRRLWPLGVPLSRAWVHFAHPDQKLRWQDLAKVSAIGAFSEASEALKLDSDETPLEMRLTKTFAPVTEILSARSSLQAEMQKAILIQIGEGQIFGMGFEPPRSLASLPKIVPKGFWSGRLEWGQNRVSYESLQLIDVRLVTKSDWNQVYKATTVEIVLPPAPAKGRPSVGPHIQAASKALLAAGLIDIGQSANSHFPVIRSWLKANVSDMADTADNLSDETIRKHFGSFFNELKKTNKQ